jgi:hypothetical protein
MFAQVVDKFPAFYGSALYISVFERHVTDPYPEPVYSSLSPPKFVQR